MKKVFLLLTTLAFAISLQAQKSLPYYTGFDNFIEKLGWKQYRLGPTTNDFYTWSYARGDVKSPAECLAHFYPVGGEEATDDWFVSPALDFSNGGIIDSIWHSFKGFGTPGSIDTIALYFLTGDQNPDSATSKEILILYTDSTYKNDNIWRYRSDIEIAPTSEDAFIAFRYQTVVNWLDAKFDNIYLSPSTSSSVHQSRLNGKISISPNPATDMVHIKLERGIQINNLNLIDHTGSVIKTYSNSINLLDVSSLPAGMYYLEFDTNKGIAVKRMVRQ